MGILVEGTITSTTPTATIQIDTKLNLSLRNFGVASINLERSFDDGSTWGSVETFTANAEKIGDELEPALYRLNPTSYSSGTIAFRIKNPSVFR